LKRPVPRSLSLSKGPAFKREALERGMEDVHPLVPQNALLEVGEASVGYESEDLFVHGDDLIRARK
jgi:hypothetical protein